MLQCNFTPCEGEGDFIFVSYSRKDGEQVRPVLEALHSRGYRVWFDQGIQYGKRWRDEVASHIDNCRVFLALHSPRSAASEDCQSEIEAALDAKKLIVSVYLEETELSIGLKMYLRPKQSINLYEYGTISRFVEGLEAGDTGDLALCRRQAESTAAGNGERASSPERLVYTVGGSGVLTIERVPASGGETKLMITLRLEGQES